jgi:hypothetical protein
MEPKVECRSTATAYVTWCELGNEIVFTPARTFVVESQAVAQHLYGVDVPQPSPCILSITSCKEVCADVHFPAVPLPKVTWEFAGQHSFLYAYLAP